MNQIFLETRMFWLSDGEEIMTLAFFVLIQYRSVTDGRTDRRTFLLLLHQRACIARYANALVKTAESVLQCMGYEYGLICLFACCLQRHVNG